MTAKTSFSCGGLLDITVAVNLQNRLRKSLEKSSTIELKAESVKKADTAGLQLFVALSREVENTGGRLIWKQPSEELIKAASLLGLDDTLGLA